MVSSPLRSGWLTPLCASCGIFSFPTLFLGTTLWYLLYFPSGSPSRLPISYLNLHFQSPLSDNSFLRLRVHIFREYLGCLWIDFLNTLQVVHGAVWLFGGAILGGTRLVKSFLTPDTTFSCPMCLLSLFLTSAHASIRKWESFSGSWDWAHVPGGPVKCCSHWLEQLFSYEIMWACAAKKRLEVDLRHFSLVWDQDCEFMILDYC